MPQCEMNALMTAAHNLPKIAKQLEITTIRSKLWSLSLSLRMVGIHPLM